MSATSSASIHGVGTDGLPPSTGKAGWIFGLNPKRLPIEPECDSLSKGKSRSQSFLSWDVCDVSERRTRRGMAQDADAALRKAIRACSDAQESMVRGRMARGKEAQALLKSLRELADGCDAWTDELPTSAVAAVDEGRDPAESTMHWIVQAQRGKGKQVAMAHLRDALLEEAQKEYPHTHEAYLEAKRGRT